MKVRLTFLAAVVAAGLVATPIAAMAQHYRAKADGYQVVSSQNTPGSATFTAKVDRDAKTIEYTLSYKNLDGNITQSHIHFNRRGFNGGIILYLCAPAGAAPEEPANTPPCELGTQGTVHHKAEAADVTYKVFGNQFPASGTGSNQGFTKGDFEALVRALDAGAGYIVVHTTAVPSGELRGQIARVEREEEASER